MNTPPIKIENKLWRSVGSRLKLRTEKMKNKFKAGLIPDKRNYMDDKH